MNDIELDENLKLLNGLNENLFKRNQIINYIKESKKICIFAYGSLLWNPIDNIDEILPNCILQNYVKGFFCEDFIYRGTTSYTGLTMALKKHSNGIVHGSLFISYDKQIISLIKSFVKRETPIDFNGTIMDIYQYDFVEILMPDGITKEYALTCTSNRKSHFHLNKQLTIDEQAFKIGQAYGINGTNFQYLEKLKIIYHLLNIKDSFSQDLQILYDKVNNYRLSLIISHQKWFQIYDQLKFLEENKDKSTSIILKNHFCHSNYSQPINQLTLL